MALLVCQEVARYGLFSDGSVHLASIASDPLATAKRKPGVYIRAYYVHMNWRTVGSSKTVGDVREWNATSHRAYSPKAPGHRHCCMFGYCLLFVQWFGLEHLGIRPPTNGAH
jgi:hypothetical protein